MRICTTCGFEGPADLFTVTRTVKGVPHYNGRCKTCYNAYHRARQKNPENIRVRRNRDLLRKYGITLDDYYRMLEDQNGVCAICSGLPIRKNATETVETLFSVDHNHITGEVRGLLCDNCNRALGYLKADSGTSLIENALKYLQEATESE